MENVKFVVINGIKYNINGRATTLEDVKTAAMDIEPGLSNADAVIEGENVVFKYRAGTKGSGLDDVQFVVINGIKYNINGRATNLEDVKAAALDIEPGLSNADAVVEGDSVVFKYRAGTKGARG